MLSAHSTPNLKSGQLGERDERLPDGASSALDQHPLTRRDACFAVQQLVGGVRERVPLRVRRRASAGYKARAPRDLRTYEAPLLLGALRELGCRRAGRRSARAAWFATSHGSVVQPRWRARSTPSGRRSSTPGWEGRYARQCRGAGASGWRHPRESVFVETRKMRNATRKGVKESVYVQTVLFLRLGRYDRTRCPETSLATIIASHDDEGS